MYILFFNKEKKTVDVCKDFDTGVVYTFENVKDVYQDNYTLYKVTSEDDDKKRITLAQFSVINTNVIYL